MIAILISCLGLFGLVTFSAESKVKEIGVRKVLGAGVPQIVTLLSKDFLMLVLVAAAIAFPVEWYGLHNFLQGYAYHTNLSWWVFGALFLYSCKLPHNHYPRHRGNTLFSLTNPISGKIVPYPHK
jgi:hypothetical protein